MFSSAHTDDVVRGPAGGLDKTILQVPLVPGEEIAPTVCAADVSAWGCSCGCGCSCVCGCVPDLGYSVAQACTVAGVSGGITVGADECVAICEGCGRRQRERRNGVLSIRRRRNGVLSLRRRRNGVLAAAADAFEGSDRGADGWGADPSRPGSSGTLPGSQAPTSLDDGEASGSGRQLCRHCRGVMSEGGGGMEEGAEDEDEVGAEDGVEGLAARSVSARGRAAGSSLGIPRAALVATAINIDADAAGVGDVGLPRPSTHSVARSDSGGSSSGVSSTASSARLGRRQPHPHPFPFAQHPKSYHHLQTHPTSQQSQIPRVLAPPAFRGPSAGPCSCCCPGCGTGAPAGGLASIWFSSWQPPPQRLKVSDGVDATPLFQQQQQLRLPSPLQPPLHGLMMSPQGALQATPEEEEREGEEEAGPQDRAPQRQMPFAGTQPGGGPRTSPARFVSYEGAGSRDVRSLGVSNGGAGTGTGTGEVAMEEEGTLTDGPTARGALGRQEAESGPAGPRWPQLSARRSGSGETGGGAADETIAVIRAAAAAATSGRSSCSEADDSMLLRLRPDSGVLTAGAPPTPATSGGNPSSHGSGTSITSFGPHPPRSGSAGATSRPARVGTAGQPAAAASPTPPPLTAGGPRRSGELMSLSPRHAAAVVAAAAAASAAGGMAGATPAVASGGGGVVVRQLAAAAVGCAESSVAGGEGSGEAAASAPLSAPFDGPNTRSSYSLISIATGTAVQQHVLQHPQQQPLPLPDTEFLSYRVPPRRAHSLAVLHVPSGEPPALTSPESQRPMAAAGGPATAAGGLRLPPPPPPPGNAAAYPYGTNQLIHPAASAYGLRTSASDKDRRSASSISSTGYNNVRSHPPQPPPALFISAASGRTATTPSPPGTTHVFATFSPHLHGPATMSAATLPSGPGGYGSGSGTLFGNKQAPPPLPVAVSGLAASPRSWLGGGGLEPVRRPSLRSTLSSVLRGLDDGAEGPTEEGRGERVAEAKGILAAAGTEVDGNGRVLGGSLEQQQQQQHVWNAKAEALGTERDSGKALYRQGGKQAESPARRRRCAENDRQDAKDGCVRTSECGSTAIRYGSAAATVAAVAAAVTSGTARGGGRPPAAVPPALGPLLTVRGFSDLAASPMARGATVAAAERVPAAHSCGDWGPGAGSQQALAVAAHEGIVRPVSFDTALGASAIASSLAAEATAAATTPPAYGMLHVQGLQAMPPRARDSTPTRSGSLFGTAPGGPSSGSAAVASVGLQMHNWPNRRAAAAVHLESGGGLDGRATGPVAMSRASGAPAFSVAMMSGQELAAAATVAAAAVVADGAGAPPPALGSPRSGVGMPVPPSVPPKASPPAAATAAAATAVGGAAPAPVPAEPQIPAATAAPRLSRWVQPLRHLMRQSGPSAAKAVAGAPAAPTAPTGASARETPALPQAVKSSWTSRGGGGAGDGGASAGKASGFNPGSRGGKLRLSGAAISSGTAVAPIVRQLAPPSLSLPPIAAVSPPGSPAGAGAGR